MSRSLIHLDLEEKAYIALFISEDEDYTFDETGLWYPLTIACAISRHVPLVCPMTSSVSYLVDRAFDGLFNKQYRLCPQGFKDFVVNSKGILYAKDITAEEKHHILEGSAFVLTTDLKVREVACSKGIPYAFIAHDGNLELEKVFLNHWRAEDDGLMNSLISTLSMFPPQSWIEKNGICGNGRKMPQYIGPLNPEHPRRVPNGFLNPTITRHARHLGLEFRDERARNFNS